LIAVFADYHIIALGIKIACKPRNISVPENYDEILSKTEAIYDIDYGSAYGDGYFDLYTAKDGKTAPLILYIHGGYYLGGDKKSAEPYCRMIASEGFTVASMNYGLAPKYKYPTQLRQVNEILGYIVNNSTELKADVTQIFIGGDSAGGHLAAQAGALYTNDEFAALTKIERNIEGENIKGLLLLCGLYNMDTVRACDFPFLNTAMWAFTDVKQFEKYPRVEELNVVDNVTKNYPSTYITCGKDDPFITQAEEMTVKLTEKKVDFVSYFPQSENTLKHEYQRDFSLPEAYTAMEEAVKFLKERSDFVSDVQRQEIHAVFTLSDGTVFDVLLDKKSAPNTVKNFIAYAEAGFYDGTAFHRILRNAVLQGGGYTYNDGEYRLKTPIFDPIKGEFSENGYNNNKISHLTGVISMARTSDKDSATSQFFFCAGDQSNYDGSYAAFGHIVNVDGIENLVRLTAVEANEVINPSEPIILKSVEIQYKDLA